MANCCVFFAARTEVLNITQKGFRVKGLMQPEGSLPWSQKPVTGPTLH